MNKQRRVLLLCLSVLLLAAAVTPVVAEDDDNWKITVAPYLLGAAMNGTVGVRGIEKKVDMSASDIFSNLKFGFNGYFEAKKGKWGFGVDMIYMNLGTFTTAPHVNVDASQGAYTFVGIRELNKRVDLQFGMRWNVVTGKLFFFDAVPPIPANSGYEMKKQWVDPVVGINWKQPLSERWLFNFGLNFAGFGVGSKIVIDCFPTLLLKVGQKAYLGAGYRWMYTDYKKDWDAARPLLTPSAFKYNMLSQGPVIGMVFRF